MFTKIGNFITNIKEQAEQRKKCEASFTDPACLIEKFKVDYVDGDLANDLPINLKRQILERVLNQDEITPFCILTTVRMIELAKRLISLNYLKPLILKSEQLIYQDEYGDTQFDKFYKEITKFINQRFHALSNNFDISPYYEDWSTRIDLADIKDTIRQYGSSAAPKQNPKKYTSYQFKDNHDEYYESNYFGCVCDEMHDDIITLIFLEHEETQTLIDFTSITNPYEYEYSVAKELSAHGWTTRVTNGSGDQGVDIVATKGDLKMVVQCKLYSQPVGNSAVQEIYSAKGFERADIAIVVTNNSFTKSAKQLANSLQVILLHHNQIGQFSEDTLGDDFDHYDESTSPPLKTRNTINICRIIAESLHDSEWITSYDPEDVRDHDDSTIIALSPSQQKIVINCTHWDSHPVDAEHVRHELQNFIELIDQLETDHLVITSSTGFTPQAELLAQKNKNLLTLIDNTEIHCLLENFQ